MLRRFLIFIFYSLYGFLLVGVLLVVMFPKDRFLILMADRVEQELPGFACNIDGVRYVHPLKVSFNQIVLTNEAERIKIPIDTLLIGFEKKWPIKQFDLIADLYGGIVKSTVTVDRASQQIEFAELTASSMHLEGMAVLQNLIDRSVQGLVSMSGKLTISGKHQGEARFQGSVQIDDFYSELRQPIFENSEIDLDQIFVVADSNRERIDLSEGRFEGSLLSGDFSGRITLQKPWQQSRIDITIGLVPQPSLLQNDPMVAKTAAQLYRKYQTDAIPCLVNGNIKDPQFWFGRKTNAGLKRVQ